MSKNRKKSKNTLAKKSPISYIIITKTYFDDFTKTAHKFMSLIGLEPSAFDALSKRTKHKVMLMRHTPYRIRAEKDSKIPRPYIKLFNQVMSNYEKTTFYGDPTFKITFMEYVTFGLTLIFYCRNYHKDEHELPQDQIALLDKIKIPLLKYVEDHPEDHYRVRSNSILNYLFLYVSQPNYRFYTSTESGVVDALKCRMENLITVSPIEMERRKFIFDRETHTGYRLGYYDLSSQSGDLAPVMAEMPINLLENENNKTKNQLMNQIKMNLTIPVYIQHHALRRAAERLDCKANVFRNIIFSWSFHNPIVITAANGQRLICAQYIKGKHVGYFPFIKVDGAVLLLSFLPLSSPITPEGSILQKELGIQLEDSKYIGLDKLSFYTKTDFSTLPQLESALKKAGMWHLTKIIPDEKKERKENGILKNFFVMK
ncbi:MAG: hypothetical protein WCP52_07285 [Bacteroidota bacterium]